MSQRNRCVVLQGLARISCHAAAGAVTAQGQIGFIGNLQFIQLGQRLPGHGQGIFIGCRIGIFRSQSVFRRNDDMLRRLGNAAADRVVDSDRVDGKPAAMIINQDRQGPTRVRNINPDRHIIDIAAFQHRIDDVRYRYFRQFLVPRRMQRRLAHGNRCHDKIITRMGSNKSCQFFFNRTHRKPLFPLLIIVFNCSTKYSR